MEAHLRVSGTNTRRNSGGRQIKNKNKYQSVQIPYIKGQSYLFVLYETKVNSLHSFLCLDPSTEKRSTIIILPGVNFSNVFRSANFIEIALSIFAVRRCPTLSHEFEANKFDDTAKGRKLLTRNRPLISGCAK